MPRRIPNYPDAFYGWNLVSSFGSMISAVSVILFFYITYNQLMYGIENKESSTVVSSFSPDFTESNNIYLDNFRAPSIEWAADTPPAQHTFNTPAIQS